MSVEIWNLAEDLCRCCHAEGSFDNLAQPKIHLETEEIYSDMLKDCFDIDISPVPGELCAMTYKICETCIVSLRNAAIFKKQVKDCELKFMELYNKNSIKACNSSIDSTMKELPGPLLMDIKVEEISQIDDDNDGGVVDDDADDDDYCQECEDDQITDLNKKTQKAKTKKKKKKRKSKQKHDKPLRPKKVSDGNGRNKYVGDQWRVFKMKPDDYKIEDGKYKCNLCDKSYGQSNSIRFHLLTHHYNIPKYACPYCIKGFNTLSPFTLHKLQEHNIDDRYNCKACKGLFNTKLALQKHINNYHMLGTTYKCDLCEYESYSVEGLYKHKFRHRTSKDYHCRFCKKSFLRKTNLDVHERIHTGDRRHVCNLCSLAFIQKSSLNYHMKKNHPYAKF